MDTQPPPSHVDQFFDDLNLEADKPIAFYTPAIHGVTGVPIWGIIQGPMDELFDVGVTLIAISAFTIARIRDHWEREGEPDRGERVANAFAYSIQLDPFWEIATSYGFATSQLKVFDPDKQHPPAIQKRLDRLGEQDPDRAKAEGELFLDLSANDDGERRSETVQDCADMIADAARRGDTEFFDLLGEAIRKPRFPFTHLHPDVGYLIPQSNQRGKTRDFARFAWLSHLYWLMPAGLLRDSNILDASKQQAKDTSRDKLPRSGETAFEHVREDDAGDAQFRLGKAWANGPEIRPSDYPREV